MTPKLVLGSGAVATLVAIALAFTPPGLRSALDLRVYDALLRESAGGPPSDQVVLVVVDDASIAEVGQWPWPRDVLGSLVDSLEAAGAAVLAFDILLSEPDRLGGATADSTAGPGLTETDLVLSTALGGARVVMGHAFTFGAGEGSDVAACGLEPLALVLVQPPGSASPAEGLPRPSGSVCSLPAFTRAAGASGFLNAQPDPDGLLRRVPLLMEHAGRVYPSLALSAVAASAGSPDVTLEPAGPDRLRLTLGGAGRAAGGAVTLPLDEGGALLARYGGGVGTFPQVRAGDVLTGRMPAEAVRDRIVFIGATALGLRDVVATPFAASLPGIEVHATVAGNILEREFMEIPGWAGVLAFLGIGLGGLGTAVLVARVGLPAGGAVAVLATLGLWLAAGRGVAAAGVFFSPVLPTVAVVLALLFMTLLRLRHEGGRADAEQLLRERTHEFTVESLTGLIGVRDPSTGEHARRTREYAAILTHALRDAPGFRSYLTPEASAAIIQLAPLHDIGKIGIADAILQKPGPLTDEEYAEMQRHPELGHQALLEAERAAGLDSEQAQQVMRIAKEIVYTHHERWDGQGYPRGLAGEAIPIPGRIMALVDAYDAMVEPRVYRGAMSHEEVSAFIASSRGTRYEPAVVDAFLRFEEAFAGIAARGGGEAAGEPATSEPLDA